MDVTGVTSGLFMQILDLAFQDSLNPKRVANTNGGEYHSPCPGCGGEDRFIIWPVKNRFYCRQCGKTGDAIQYLRDFRGLSFKRACLVAGQDVLPFYGVKKSVDYVFQTTNNPTVEWQAYAGKFIDNCHESLLNTPLAIALLANRGISIPTIKKFRLGWNLDALWPQWTLGNTIKRVWLPKGLVIPAFHEGNPVKIKIRRTDWKVGDHLPKYVEIHGSSPNPVVYGAVSLRPILVLESELDAILVQQEAASLCSAVALGGVTKKPSQELHNQLRMCSCILLSLDWDSAGKKAVKWWRKHYSNLSVWFTPFEKSVGDAFESGLNIKEWILQGIRKDGTNSKFEKIYYW